MQIDTIAVGDFEANCHIVYGNSKSAIVIDPGGDADLLISKLKEEGLDVAAYMLTHGHIDHVEALAEMYECHKAPIGMHRADLDKAFNKQDPLLPFCPVPQEPENIDRVLEDEQVWNDGELSYRVISTPGHTPGSVCFYFPDNKVLFTGDTLFALSVGRTDFPGGDINELKSSLKTLSAMPDDTIVYSGHGPKTTIGTEKKNNPFMNGRMEV